MASQDEVIRYAYKVSGSKELQAVARLLLETGGASEEVEASVRGLADEFGALAKQASQAQGLQSTIETFRQLAAQVLATEKNITSAKAKVAELGKAISSTEEPTKAQTREFEAARRALENLEKTQTTQRAKLTELKTGFTEAGLSTRNLVSAEKELAARMQASQAAMAGLVTSARATASARQQAAAAERALLDQLRNTVAQQQQAARATESLQRAREILAQRSTTASASERTYAQSLGTSAAKIAAIGAAALGINSAVGLARTTLSQLIETAGEFQKLDVQLDSVFKGDSEAAFDRITQFAKETPYQLNQVAESFVKLKAFGLDPMDGTFQAIADQAAALGGSQETLTGITLALGQAQAKQKLQGEEILQLVERGVPVWDLLSRATGKSTIELQKLSEAGKLGRTEIKLLIDEIGKSSEGTAAALANTLPGQINRLKTQYQEFLNLVANSGVLDYLTQQLSDISAEVQRLADSGELQAWAKDVADAIVGAARAIAGITGFLIEHRDAILALAGAYATFKGTQVIAGLATAFAGLAGRVVAGTVALQGAAAASTAFLGPLGLLAAALAFTANATINLVENYQALKSEWAEAEAAAQDFLDTNDALRKSSQAAQEEYSAFADVAIAKSGELAAKNEAGTQAYIEQLKGAIQYTVALGNEAIATGDNVAKISARERLAELRASLEAAKQQMVDLRDASAMAFETIGPFGLAAVAAFDGIVASGKSARDAVEGIFKDVDFTKQEGLVQAAAAVKAIGTRGTEAAAEIRDELREQILKLSDEDFVKFQAAAKAAFAAGVQGAEELKSAVASINLTRLGVDVEEIRTGFSSAGRAAVDAFSAARTEVNTLGLTAEQRAKAIGIAFDAALGKAKTQADMQALQEALQRAFDAGEIGIESYMRKIEQIGAKVAGIKAPDIPAPNTGAVTSALQGVQKGADGVSTSLQNVGTSASSAMQSVAQETRGAAAGLQQVDKQAGETAQGVGSAAQAIQNIYAGFANELGKTSQAAMEEFTSLTRQIFELGAGIADFSGLARFGKAAQDAFDIVSAKIEQQKIGVAGMSVAYTEMSDAALLAAAKTRGGFDQVADGLANAAAEARAGRSEFDLLGTQDLSQLSSALDSAAQRTRQLGEEAANAKRELADLASSYQDQIDQIEGNQDTIELRRHQRELQRIKERAEATGNANSSEYNDAVAAESRLHDLKMRNIRREEEASRNANSSTSSSSPRRSGDASGGQASGTSSAATYGNGGIAVNINLGGQTVTVRADSQAEVNRLIDMLRRAALSSGGGGAISG